jgi:hypothetical protein
MSNVHRPNRKVSDADVIRMNSVGLSLSTIAKLAGCHPTTITKRLESLNVEPADTRRTFMEDVFRSLSTNQQEWLADQLGPHISIKDYVRNLITQEWMKKNGQHPQANPGLVQDSPA